MFKKRKNSFWPILLVLLFLFSVIFMVNRNLFFFEKIIKDVSLSVFNISLRSNEEKTNQQLETRILELEYQIMQIESDLDFQSELLDFEYIYARVVNRNLAVWLNEFTINKGEFHQIEAGMPVVVNNTLVGTIGQTSYLNSSVKLLTGQDLQLSVKILNNNIAEYGILVDYDESKNVFILEGFKNTDYFEIGDLVTTTGLTEKFPPGLIVGEVIKIKDDNFGLAKIIYARPLIDYNRIHNVIIIKGANNDNSN